MEINDRRLKRQFYDIRSTFELLTGTIEDNCFLVYIFSEMAEVSGCVQKKDMISSFLEQMYGVMNTAYYENFISRNERYEQTMNRYRFSGRMSELGTFWKELMENRNYIDLERSMFWLEQIDSYFLPKAFRMISLWETETENYENKMNMRERKQHFNSYRRLIRDTIQLFENAIEILHMFDQE